MYVFFEAGVWVQSSRNIPVVIKDWNSSSQCKKLHPCEHAPTRADPGLNTQVRNSTCFFIADIYLPFRQYNMRQPIAYIVYLIVIVILLHMILLWMLVFESLT